MAKGSHLDCCVQLFVKPDEKTPKKSPEPITNLLRCFIFAISPGSLNVWHPMCFCLDLTKSGHSSRKCWDDFISSSFKQLMQLAFGKLMNPYRTVSSWNSNNHWKVNLAESEERPRPLPICPRPEGHCDCTAAGSWACCAGLWRRSQVVNHKKQTELLPVPTPKLLRLNYLS